MTRNVLVGFLLLAAGGVEFATAQLSLFSYQGRLSQGSDPVDGTYEFQFSIWNAPTDGNTVGLSIIRVPLTVQAGSFHVNLDFGGDVFDGSPRWLEIGLRTNGTQTPFTILTPRQRVASTPYATFSGTSANATVAQGLVDGGAGLTSISGNQILTGSISSAQLDPALDAAYRATDTNRVRLVLGQTNPVVVINVKDWGARGDGVTDDSVAISNAWRVLITSGGTLYFPPGIYLDSNTHTCDGWLNAPAFVNAGYYRSGRLVRGDGNVIWRYTGSSQMFGLSNSAPDFEGLWFEGTGSSASNCMSLTKIWNKWNLKNCFFANWNNTRVGALIAADADSMTLSGVHFYRCNIGVGLGFNCSNFKGDIRGDHCGTVVAAGVPTPAFPTVRGSPAVDLNLNSVYCGTALAINAGGPIRSSIFAWWNTNGVVWFGAIPGVATNSETIRSVHIYDSWVNQGSTAAQSPILLWQNPYQVLRLENNNFEFTGSSPKPVVKSLTAAADAARFDWMSTAVKLDNVANLAPIFQDSTGVNFPSRSIVHQLLVNRGLKIYNRTDWANPAINGDYLLDVVAAANPSGNSSIARFGRSWGTGDFADFWGGLSIRHDGPLNAPVVAVTNAILEVSGNRAAGAAVGGVRVADTVNATNGFLLGTVKIVSGVGSPEGVVEAPAGSLYLRTDGDAGTTLYVKTGGSPNTGWLAK